MDFLRRLDILFCFRLVFGCDRGGRKATGRIGNHLLLLCHFWLVYSGADAASLKIVEDGRQ